ncbi:translation initiation factor IF-2 subunit beta [Candidatus Nanosalina sp. VS9-1]|uniref:translation initiation factor IF-2 subunit beta n=1 Tax=Candidatus Nanosalina sp. VS9-1 TaxID=3388566 RepID=UPI0039E01756
MTDDYEDLLEKGLEEVPEESGSGERFEMPEVDTRKDGSKTIVVNFSEIADKLNREKDRLSKYLQNELGTAGRLKEGELVLNGELRRGNIQGRLQNFAEDFVFCPECDSPDTEIVKEKGVQLLKCQACGARNPLNSA